MKIYSLDMGSPEGLILFYSAPIIVIALIIISAGIISMVKFSLKLKKEKHTENTSDETAEGESTDEC